MSPRGYIAVRTGLRSRCERSWAITGSARTALKETSERAEDGPDHDLGDLAVNRRNLLAPLIGLVAAALSTACGSSGAGAAPTTPAGCVKLWNQTASASFRAAAQPPTSPVNLLVGDTRTAITPQGDPVSTVRAQREGAKHACWIDVTYPQGWDGLPVTITYSALSGHSFHALSAIGGLGSSVIDNPALSDPQIAWNPNGTIRLTGKTPVLPDALSGALTTLVSIPKATADSLAACASRYSDQTQGFATCATEVTSLASRATSAAAQQIDPSAASSYTCQTMLGSPLQQQITRWGDMLSEAASLPSYAPVLQSSAANVSLGFRTLARDCGIATGNSTSTSGATAPQNTGGSTSIYDAQTVVASRDGAGGLSPQPTKLNLSGDGTAVVKNLQWHGWGGSTAQGAGLLGINDCTPACYNGAFTWKQATITLSDVGTCLGQQAYLSFAVAGVNGGQAESLDFSGQCTADSTRSSSSSSSNTSPPVSWWGFQTPSRNIVCTYDPSGITCAVLSASDDRGLAEWTVGAEGTASFARVVANAPESSPSLGYGRSWKRSGIDCDSEEDGLTCRNLDGHGFFLSRDTQRTF